MVLKIKLFGIALSLLVLLGAQEARAEEYVIGTDDVLSITFWQQPDLNSRVRVKRDGTISLPIIGEVKAEGLSQEKLSSLILEKMSRWHPPGDLDLRPFLTYGEPSGKPEVPPSSPI
jgi:protein involved in polysaccharide export with SLBB domain